MMTLLVTRYSLLVTRSELKSFLPPEEHDRLVGNVNTATK
jgi:hypothetical protein